MGAPGDDDEGDGSSRGEALTSPAFIALVFANVAWFLGFATFFLLPKFLVTELNATEQQVGWIMASFGLLSVTALPVVGSFSDRLGRRPFLLAGASILGGTSALFLLVEQVGPLVYLLRAVQGLAFACWFVSSSTLVIDLVDARRRGGALGIFGISTLSTHGIAPSLAEWLAQVQSYQWVFVLAIGYTLAAAALALAIPDRARHRHHEQSARSVGRIMAAPALGLIVIASLLCGIGFGTALVYSQPLALQRGISLVTAFLIAYSLTSVLVRIFFSRLPDLPDKRVVVLPSISLMGAGVAWLFWMDSMTEFVAAGALMGLGHSLTYPTMNALLINRLYSSEHGRGMSLFVGGFNIGMITAQVVFGYLTNFLPLATLFLLAGGLVWLALPVFLIAATAPVPEPPASSRSARDVL